MKKHEQNNAQHKLFSREKQNFSSALLSGYDGRSFEKTMKHFWKSVEGFSCEWREGWDESPVFDYAFSEDERAVTFVTSIKTETEEATTYALYNTAGTLLYTFDNVMMAAQGTVATTDNATLIGVPGLTGAISYYRIAA